MSRIDERLEIMGVDTSEMTDEEKFTAATGLTRYDEEMAANDWYVPAGAGNTLDEASEETGEQGQTSQAEPTGEPTGQNTPTGEPTGQNTPTGEPTADAETTGEPTAVAEPTGEPTAVAEQTGEPSTAEVETGDQTPTSEEETGDNPK